MDKLAVYCHRCDRALGSNYWMYVFNEDGTEEKIYRGKPQTTGKNHVSVLIHTKCPRSGKRKRHDDWAATSRKLGCEPKRGVPEDPFKNFNVARKNGRLMMVLPKMVGMV